jgi:hypothetical protein
VSFRLDLEHIQTSDSSLFKAAGFALALVDEHIAFFLWCLHQVEALELPCEVAYYYFQFLFKVHWQQTQHMLSILINSKAL